MKKTILLATSLLLLTACSQQKSQPVDITDQLQKIDNTEKGDTTIAQITGNEIKKYSSKELSVSFDYPSSWEVKEDSTKKSITLISPKRSDINYRVNVNIPAKSFEEYEKYNKEVIQEKTMSVQEKSPTDNKNYLSKEYGYEGGVTYLIKIDKSYISVDSEKYLDKKLKEELDVILNSISL